MVAGFTCTVAHQPAKQLCCAAQQAFGAVVGRRVSFAHGERQQTGWKPLLRTPVTRCWRWMNSVRPTLTKFPKRSTSCPTGAGKSRALRSGDAQKPKEWRVIFISTGELRMETKLTQGHKTKTAMAGQLARMVDIEADGGHGFGVFDSCGGFEDASSLARAIGSAASKDYGSAGPEFLERTHGGRSRGCC